MEDGIRLQQLYIDKSIVKDLDFISRPARVILVGKELHIFSVLIKSNKKMTFRPDRIFYKKTNFSYSLILGGRD